MNTKLIILTLLITAVFLFSTGNVASALTESQIQSILSLLSAFGAEQSVIDDVDAALRGESIVPVASSSATVIPACSYAGEITNILRRGSTDDSVDGQVTALQQFLAHYQSIYPEGLITGYFGPATERAVQRWQAQYSVVSSGSPKTTGYGVVGPKTRSAIMAYCTQTEPQEVGVQGESTTEDVPGEAADTITETSDESAPSEEVATAGPSKNTHSMDLEMNSSQYLFILDDAQQGLDLTGDFTIEAWINVESIEEPGCNSCNKQHTIIDKTKDPTGEFAYSFYWRKNRGETLLVSSSENNIVDTIYRTFVLDTRQWYHFAVSFNSSSGIATFYRNGASIGSSLIQPGFGSAIKDTSAPFYIGSKQGVSDFLDGKIDDVRVWNVARSAQEVQNNYMNELSGNEQGLVAYWKFDNELVDGKAKDSSPNGNNLTLENNPVFSADTPF